MSRSSPHPLLERMAQRVHALRWLFPSDILLTANVSNPFLVLHVDTVGNLPLGSQAVDHCKEVSPIRAIESNFLLSESIRPCPFQPWSEPDWLWKCSDWLVRSLGPDAVREIRQIRVNATGQFSGLRVRGSHIS